MAGMMLIPIGRCRFNDCETILERFPQNVGEASIPDKLIVIR